MNGRAVIVTCAVVVSSVACTGRYIRPTTDEKVELTSARVERGRYLVNGVAACPACHAAREAGSMANPEDADHPVSGGVWMDEPALNGGLWASNLTSDAETGLGTWTDDQIIRAIRDGIAKDERVLFPIMPYTQYRYMSDEDVRAVVAYLRSLPPAKPVTPRRPNELPFMFRTMLGLGVTLHEPVKAVATPERNRGKEWGAYVARLGNCVECHSLGERGARPESDRLLGGSDVPFLTTGVGKIWAPNLTSDETGLGKYTAEQIKTAMRTGMRLDGKPMGPPMSYMMPHYALVDDVDLDALVAYLQSVPPVKSTVPPRELEPSVVAMYEGK